MGAIARGYRFSGATAAEQLRERVRASSPSLLVQTVDSAAASGEEFLGMVANQTLEASASGTGLAQKPEVDLLLRLAGTTQISDAIEKVGAKRGRSFLLVVAGAPEEIARLESGEGLGWERLPSGKLTAGDFARIEKAALLNAERA